MHTDTALPHGLSAHLLKDGQASDICAELSLAENQDGLFISADKGLYLFPVGAFLPWQKTDAALRFNWLGGAPLTLSFSPDGHDAGAVHLGPQPELHQHLTHELAAQFWHTAESLGSWTLVQRDGAHSDITRAAPDWFPTPRQSGQT